MRAPGGAGAPYTEEVADGLFAYVQPDGSWFINTTGFIPGRRTTLCIDTCATEARTRALLAAVDRRAPGGARTLVNTHHHGDHTNGNSLLGFATTIGHRRCRQEMVRAGILRPDGLFEPVEWGELSVSPPFVVFDERLTVYVDDLEVELLHLTTAAHSSNDVVAWVPEHRVLFSGDLVFNGGTPFVLMGSVAGSLEALDRVAELDPAVIVPGHGPPCDLDAVARCGAYLRAVQQHAEAASAAGVGALEAARTFDVAAHGPLTDPERIVGNLHRALAELAGTRGGEDIDYAAAFADMMTMNGGRPLRCHA